jgi:hypothetical protein
MNISLNVALFLGTFGCGLANSQTLQEVTKYGIWDKAVLIPSTSFDSTSIRQQALVFGREAYGKCVIGRLVIGTDQSEVLAASIGTGRLHAPGYCEQPGRFPKSAIARCFALNGSVLLSYRPKGDFKRPSEVEVLGGARDPTSFLVGHSMYRLLHFHYGSRGEPWNVTLYFQSSSDPSLAECKVLIADLRNKLKADRIAISVRTDTFFVGDPDFPENYPFHDGFGQSYRNKPLLPEPLDYYRSAALFLSTNGDEIIVGEAFKTRP